ncbi:hypothetical protein ACPOL_6206 [Acidisarcina polymorpha]|uniref:Uncharacterized protein n=1 Tax=Acidisarcina polymorpha TaxID=2211140 RepID=A0A2Z5G903_9BACT|nr:hypothetical protein ACPOL_6206 [Acidisarcina polymorpha]
MASPVRTSEDLLKVFAEMIWAPPTQGTELLVRHLKCKESVELAKILVDAIPQYAERGGQRLQPPSELLVPLA